MILTQGTNFEMEMQSQFTMQSFNATLQKRAFLHNLKELWPFKKVTESQIKESKPVP